MCPYGTATEPEEEDVHSSVDGDAGGVNASIDRGQDKVVVGMVLLDKIPQVNDEARQNHNAVTYAQGSQHFGHRGIHVVCGTVGLHMPVVLRS